MVRCFFVCLFCFLARVPWVDFNVFLFFLPGGKKVLG